MTCRSRAATHVCFLALLVSSRGPPGVVFTTAVDASGAAMTSVYSCLARRSSGAARATIFNVYRRRIDHDSHDEDQFTGVEVP